MLHIIQHQQFTAAQLQTLQAAIAANDCVVLIADAVYLANTLYAVKPTVAIYALADDITARGLQTLLSNNVKQIDYSMFVELTEKHTPICPW